MFNDNNLNKLFKLGTKDIKFKFDSKVFKINQMYNRVMLRKSLQLLEFHNHKVLAEQTTKYGLSLLYVNTICLT